MISINREPWVQELGLIRDCVTRLRGRGLLGGAALEAAQKTIPFRV